MDAAIISRIAHEVSLPEVSVTAAVSLLEKGASSPFIVHYRKEVTGGLDEAKTRAIQERYTYYREILERRAAVLKVISDQGKLSDDLRSRVESSFTKVELEDLYHQFRPKKKSRAAEAIEKGLEPLAEYLWNQETDAWSLQEHIDVFVDPAKKVATREQALQGATEIIAQWVAENIDYRKALRELLWKEGAVVSTVVPAKAQQKTKYIMYYDRRESVTTIPSHRVLAIRRGSKEGILTSSIEGNHANAIEYLLGQVIHDRESAFAPILEAAIRESYNRILRQLIETEVRAQLKERADREAIRVFQENLSNLLLSPPAGQMVVAGLDMVKSGECTLAVVDERGVFLEDCVIRFTPPKAAPARNLQEVKGGAKSGPDRTKIGEPASVQPSGTSAETQPVTEAVRVSEPPETAALTLPQAAGLEETGPDTATVQSLPEFESAAIPDPAAEAVVEEVPEPHALAEAAAESTEVPAQDLEGDVSAAPETGSEIEQAATVETAPQARAGAAFISEASAVSEVNSESVGAAEEVCVPIPATPAEPAQAAEATDLTLSGPAAEPPGLIHEVAAPVPEPTAAPEAPAPAPQPAPPVDYMAKAKASILELLAKHSVQAVAIGAGTGARELEVTLRQILAEGKMENVLVAAVNDAGIAVYSSSRVAREELPDLTVSARCAVSLARRLQDPLAEMVKIDPKLIGVGQYQHDVDQKDLHRGLLQTVQFCVNKVGVDLNTAGYSLLRYVSGLNDRLAHRIVASRNAGGPFPARQSLLNVPGIDPATFEQAAGFLRIRGGENPLDATAVHPASYPIVEKMAGALGVAIADLIGNKERISALKLEEFTDGNVGLPTLMDIREELLRPGRDPRRTFALPKFRSDVKDLNDLKKGMVLEGTVTNVTNFGAFVDVGVHQDGLVHLSQMSNRFIRDPREAVKVGDVVQVKVISVEVETKRIGLSMKALLPSGSRRRRKAHRPGARPPQTEGVPRSAEPSPSPAVKDAGETPPSARPERGERRVRDRGRPRRRDNRRPDRPAGAAPELKPQVPEPSLQEKIAILQSKFRGIS